MFQAREPQESLWQSAFLITPRKAKLMRRSWAEVFRNEALVLIEEERSWAAALGWGRRDSMQGKTIADRADATLWGGWVVWWDGSGAVGAVRHALAGLAIEPGRG